jgi:MFS family permease
MLIPTAIGLMTASPMAPRLVDRFGTKRVVCGGLTLVAAATACYGSNTIMSDLTTGFLVRLVIGIGFGITSAPVTESIMGSLPPSRAGVGSAVNDTTRQTGGATGVAVIGSIFAARYHATIGSLSFLPPSARSVARESIGTSLQVASRLGGTAGAQLQLAARHAYLASMRVTYAIVVMIVLSAIGVAYRYLPAQAIPAATEESYVDPSSDVNGRARRKLALGDENVRAGQGGWPDDRES